MGINILRENIMKTLIAILASIILITSFTANAGKYKSNEDQSNKSSTTKALSIESLLAEKSLKQGDIAKRIRTQNIETWRRLDNRHILIEGRGRNKDFLIEFRNKCHGTRHRSTLIYKTTNNELTKFDSIGILDSFMSSRDVLRPTHTCSIKQIYQLEAIEDKSSNNGDKEEQKKDKKSNEPKEISD